jgi:hypothetical protein
MGFVQFFSQANIIYVEKIAAPLQVIRRPEVGNKKVSKVIS